MPLVCVFPEPEDVVWLRGRGTKTVWSCAAPGCSTLLGCTLQGPGPPSSSLGRPAGTREPQSEGEDVPENKPFECNVVLTPRILSAAPYLWKSLFLFWFPSRLRTETMSALLPQPRITNIWGSGKAPGGLSQNEMQRAMNE